MTSSITASVSFISSKLTLVMYYYAGPGGRAVARLLGLWVRIPRGLWEFVSFECCVVK
jgi:hypothetical protein